jgi:hypothetical protein
MSFCRFLTRLTSAIQRGGLVEVIDMKKVHLICEDAIA